jgi:hypothetical protein
MGNRNFDDDDFRFDDDFGSDDDNLSGSSGLFDDDDAPSAFDDLAGEDTGDTGGGTNRTFIIIAAVMILLFLVGLGLVLFLVFGESPEDIAFAQTRSAIETQNAVIQQQSFESATAALVIAQQQTQDAVDTANAPTLTPTPTETLSPTPTGTVDPTLQAAQLATDSASTATEAFNQTQTATFSAVVEVTTPAPSGGTASFDLTSVGQTATALALTLAPPGGAAGGGGDEATPTRLGTGTSGTTGGVTTGGLPNTGLFDDITGPGGVGAFIMMAFGLIGIIVVSRRVRANLKNEEEQEDQTSPTA